MKNKAKVVGSVGHVVPHIVGRTADGNLVVDFVVVHRLAIANVSDTDNVEWNINNNTEVWVNGVQICGKKEAKRFGIDWSQPMIISKEGKILYKKSRKPVFSGEM